MCGRFVSSTPPDELAKYFDVEAVAETVVEPDYNVAPSRDIYVVVESGGVRRLDTFHHAIDRIGELLGEHDGRGAQNEHHERMTQGVQRGEHE